MTEITTRYACRKILERSLPAEPSSWLTNAELGELRLLNHTERRSQWLQGRYLSKLLVSTVLTEGQLSRIEILTRNGENLGITPQVRIDSQLCDLSLSVSHSVEGVYAGVSCNPVMRVGVDLISRFECNLSFQETWFTDKERQWLHGRFDGCNAELWGLKEAFFKAANTGESWTPGKVEVLQDVGGAVHCHFFGEVLKACYAKVKQLGSQRLVVVCVPCNKRMTLHRIANQRLGSASRHPSETTFQHKVVAP